MRTDVGRDLSDSAVAFRDLAWPVIKDGCGGGELIPVELVTEHEFQRVLDMLAGIDAWQVVTGEGIRGIASRVQWPNEDERGAWLSGRTWDSFTIRVQRTSGAKTELEKRLGALDNGWLLPYWTVQAYVSARFGGELCSAARIRTVDLLGYIRQHQKDGDLLVRATTNASFAIAYWRELQSESLDVFVWQREK